MHSAGADAYTLCNLDSQTYSTLPASPYHHHQPQQHYQPPAAPTYLHQNDYFTDCFRNANNWASSCGTSGHVVDAISGEACIKRSRGAFYDGGTAAVVLYGHHPGVARPPGAAAPAAFDFPFPGFCAAGADVASPSNTSSGCGYAAAAAAAAFYGVESGANGSNVLRSSRPGDYEFYPGYHADQPVASAHHPQPASNSLDLCSGAAASEYTAALCTQRTGHSPTALTPVINDQHRSGSESNCTTAQNSAATYKWMTVKRGAPKSTGQLP